MLEGEFGGGLFGEIDSNAGLAIGGENFAGPFVGFEFDAGAAGNKVALAHSVGAEGVAGDFDVGFFLGFVVHHGEAALLKDEI